MRVVLLPSEPFDFPESPLLGIFQRHQAEALALEGVEVGVVAPQRRSLRYLPVLARHPRRLRPPREALGYPVLRARGWDLFPRSPGPQRRAFLATGLRLFEEYLRRCGIPDVVHAHNTLPAGELAFQISRRHGLPYVVTEHHSRFLAGEFDAVERERILRTLTGAGAVLAVSRALAERIGALCGRPTLARVVPNVLPPEVESIHPDLGTPPAGDITFACVAGLVPIKNHELLLRAFACAFRGDLSARLRVVGGGPLLGRLGTLATQLGVSAQVTFTGALGRAELVKELARASAVVLSSQNETFGLALVEAMYFGKPVVSTRCGGPEDVVEEGTGILVPPGDVTAYAEALRDVRRRLSTFSPAWIHERCVARYGRQAIVAALRTVYDEVRVLR
jgi:glycosyltransferase involved in cell wall biosynthesis